ncbi:roadblock/LC7 domain-containing protein [Streptomyces sp. NPDC055078]
MTSQIAAPKWKLRGLEWLLEQLAAQVPHTTRAVLASRDGLVGSSTGPLEAADMDRFAAAASSLYSLGNATVETVAAGLNEEVAEVVIRHKNCFVFVMAAGQGSLLAVATDTSADPGRVGHEMALLVQQVGEHLATPDRTTPAEGQ